MDSKTDTKGMVSGDREPNSGIRINLGCWTDIKPGWINCDLYPQREDVVKVDLNQLPLPFPNDYADEILLSHVLEHMENKYCIVMDCHRILKPGGILNIRLPIHANRLEHTSFYHQKNYFQTLYLNSGQNYGSIRFDLLSIKKHIHPCRARIKERYYRLLTWLQSLVYLEYHWMLKKR